MREKSARVGCGFGGIPRETLCPPRRTTKKTNQESALTAKKADLEGTQKELDAALAYAGPWLNLCSRVVRGSFSEGPG